MTISAVRALTFDVFGTVVDWRSSVIAQVEAVATAAGVTGDWAAFADEWRYDGDIAGIGRVGRGEGEDDGAQGGRDEDGSEQVRSAEHRQGRAHPQDESERHQQQADA
ncbi:MAG TPA: hypothetical protein PKA49_17265, partial [Tepidiformaceae bacterium]|nr:hypothetical protein [Tepidiformaceae bacterium]